MIALVFINVNRADSINNIILISLYYLIINFGTTNFGTTNFGTTNFGRLGCLFHLGWVENLVAQAQP